MSIKNQIVTELKSIAEDVIKDVITATQLAPAVNVTASAVHTAQKKHTSLIEAARVFKDEVIHNATEGAQAVERLSRPLTSRLWSQPSSVILKDGPVSAEEGAFIQYLDRMQKAVPSHAKYRVCEPENGRTPLAEVMKKAGVTAEEFKLDVEAMRDKPNRVKGNCE